MSEDKLHPLYCHKLKKIGEKLGYEIRWKNAEENKLYHLANPDCIWYQEVSEKLKGQEGIIDMIPLFVFEVLYSEKEKNMRGSLASFLIRGAYLGVFVVLKPEDQSVEEYGDRIKYIRDMIDNLGFGRFAVWEADVVDSLEKNLGIA